MRLRSRPVFAHSHLRCFFAAELLFRAPCALVHAGIAVRGPGRRGLADRGEAQARKERAFSAPSRRSRTNRARRAPARGVDGRARHDFRACYCAPLRTRRSSCHSVPLGQPVLARAVAQRVSGPRRGDCWLRVRSARRRRPRFQSRRWRARRRASGGSLLAGYARACARSASGPATLLALALLLRRASPGRCGLSSSQGEFARSLCPRAQPRSRLR